MCAAFNCETKTPIWKIATKQATRILRYKEVIEILRNLELEPEGAWTYNLPVSKGTVQIWLQALLVTGMRHSELHILHDHPELFQDDGTILLDKNVFYDVGKQKQTLVERVIYLSDTGMKIMPEFFDVPMISPDPKKAYNYLDTVLVATGKKLGYPERTIQFKEKQTIGIEQVEVNGIKQLRRITSPVEKTVTTNGLSVRVFRKTWNSWLVNYFKNDNNALTIAEMSMGHTDQIALQHYLSLQFDEDDTKDIERAVKGFGLHPGWKNKEVKEKENTGSKDGNDNTNKDQIEPKVNNQESNSTS